MKWLTRIAAVLALSAYTALEAHAIGKVYARIPNSPNSPIYCLRIKTLHATVRIQDQLAVTHVDQEFANDNALRLEGFYIFQLPQGAQVNELYLWINGVRVPYTVKRREDAVVKYQEIVSRIADPAILEQLGSNLFKLRIFPFDAMSSRRIEIIYSQPLTYYKGTIQYTFPLDMRDYTSAPIELVSISIDLKSQLPVPSVQTSVDQYPAAVSVVQVDSFHWKIVYGVENVAFSNNFFVRCDVNRGSRAFLPLCYAPADSLGEDPYALIWMAVPDTLYGDSVTTRELTFVADISSSMEGVRLQQVQDALLSFIELLTDEDSFNIIAFSTTTMNFVPDLTPATGSARDSARLFVQQLAARGLTNIDAATRSALMQGYRDSTHAAIIFLTDGQPSWGETNTDSLLARATRWNTKGIPIFPVSVGYESDVSLMAALAERSGGLLTEIAAEDSIYLKMKDLYRLLFLPPIRTPSVDFRSLGVFETYPSPLPTVHAGDQFLLAGRFQRPGTDTVSLSGTIGGSPVSVRDRITLTVGDTAMPAVARYWGAEKIRWLLHLIDSVGEQKELVDQVVALSIRYSVLTPYTAFLVVEPASGGTGAVQDHEGHQYRFALFQNYPNPFNPTTRIEYQIACKAFVTLTVVDLLGREVARLVEEEQGPGSYAIRFDASGLASGLYFYRLQARPRDGGQAGDFVQTCKLLLLH